MVRRMAALAAASALIGAAGVLANTDGATAQSHQPSPPRQVYPAPRVPTVAAAERSVGKEISLIVIGHQTAFAATDLAPEGPSSGDFFWLELRLYDESDTTIIGKLAGRCENGITANYTCEATFRLDGRGKIRASGAVFGRSDNVYPVTGGTGEFAGVGGESHRFFLPHGKVLFLLHLIN